MRSVVGDVRKLSDVRGAMEGVDAVIHTAGLVSFGTFPDVAAMQEVNVKGRPYSLLSRVYTREQAA